MKALAVLVVLAACGQSDAPSQNLGSATFVEPPHVPPPPVGSAIDVDAPPLPIKDVLARDAAAHEPTIVEMSAVWCHPCQIFAQTTLKDPRVQAALKDVDFVRYDVDVKPGTDVAAQYNVQALPLFMALGPDGKVLRAQDGAVEGDAGVTRFVAFVQGKSEPTDAQGGPPFAIAPGDYPKLVLEKRAAVMANPGTANPFELELATVDCALSPAERHTIFQAVFGACKTVDGVNQVLYVALAAGAVDEALAAARRTMTDSTDPAILDSLAECFHAHGDRAGALRVEDQAIAAAKDSPTGAMYAASLAANRKRFASGDEPADEVVKIHETIAMIKGAKPGDPALIAAPGSAAPGTHAAPTQP